MDKERPCVLSVSCGDGSPGGVGRASVGNGPAGADRLIQPAGDVSVECLGVFFVACFEVCGSKDLQRIMAVKLPQPLSVAVGRAVEGPIDLSAKVIGI